MIISEDEYLEHYGTPRRSGRYPWGSGDDLNTNLKADLLGHIKELKAKGFSEEDIRKGYDIPSTKWRALKTMANAQKKQAEIATAQRLKDKGLSNGAIAERMGASGESYVRSLLAPGAADKADQLTSISSMLKSEVDQKTYIDIGKGVENHVRVSKQRLDVAVEMLKEQGYQVHLVPAPQSTGHEIDRKVLVPPGVTQKETWQNQSKIQQLSVVSSNYGREGGWSKFHPPIAVDPKRLDIVHGEEGAKKDGMIYVREGVPDVSLGAKRYAQVRVQIGPDHYIKGMAMYKEGLPEGKDLQFHTAKDKNDPKILKKLEDDPELPFGSVVSQIKIHEGDPKRERVTSAMNLVNEEGDWKKWNRNISAQALSKQSPSLARTQLDKTFKSRKDEYDEIMSYNNPAVRKKLLETFADQTDKSAVHLKAAALERQNWHVILPIDSIKPGEIYAPKYNQGERVVLIRYPHGGTFEIPDLVVNNRHPESRRLIGDASDAVGIHHSVAKHLSGADFDGDTVLVIPNHGNKIKVAPALEGLQDFDPHRLYKLPAGQKFTGNKQQLMGDVSNLITDMTLKGAPHDKIAQAVRHSMVVIDAEKHDLDHRLSAQMNGIRALKAEYQRRPDGQPGGASTLISRAKSKEFVPHRKPRPHREGGPIDKETGELRFVPTNKKRLNAKGERVPRQTQSTKLAETSDAHTLVSDANTRIERIYADHSNRLKGLANQARLSMIRQPSIKRNSSAAKAYAHEVEQLKAKIDFAKRNSPLERQAQALTQQALGARRAANPNLDSRGDTYRKLRAQELEKARLRVGAKKELVKISSKEWDAIQAGAISNSMMKDILNNADLEVVRKLATPRPKRMMTQAKTTQALSLLQRGYTRAEVASRLGVSVSTLDLATSGDAEEED